LEAIGKKLGGRTNTEESAAYMLQGTGMSGGKGTADFKE